MSYIYRYDPVPGVHKLDFHRDRMPKTTNERRLYFACEDAELIRSKRGLPFLMNGRDGMERCGGRLLKCWKAQTKKKRQHGFNQENIRRRKRVAA